MATEQSARDFWTIDEAAAYIRVSPFTLARWVRNKKPKKKKDRYPKPAPPYIRFCQSYRFPIEEFKAWARRPAEQEKAA